MAILGQVTVTNGTEDDSLYAPTSGNFSRTPAPLYSPSPIHYIESLASREFSLLQDRPQDDAKDSGQNSFEAQLLTRQALNENRDSFSAIISQLRDRLESLVLKNNPSDEKERARLLEDINTSKQCLEVCKAAKEVSCQKIYRIGEVIADGDSDQVVVTTLADLFDIKKAVSKGNSAQLVGSMTEEALHHLTDRRYSSRFGSLTLDPAEAVNAGLPSAANEPKAARPAFAAQASHGEPSPELKGTYARPSSNDRRKRSILDG
jgi:hypothetical protein